MPMDPMDVMWMTKAPTVNEVVSQSNIVFKPAVAQQSSPLMTDDSIRCDVDNEISWKASRIDRKTRTISTDSVDSEIGRKCSLIETPTTPVEIRPRRMSISEMIFGSPSGGFSWGQSSSQTSPMGIEKKHSVTEDSRFKELMKHQNKILGDDGVGSAFKKRDYTMA